MLHDDSIICSFHALGLIVDWASLELFKPINSSQVSDLIFPLCLRDKIIIQRRINNTRFRQRRRVVIPIRLIISSIIRSQIDSSCRQSRVILASFGFLVHHRQSLKINIFNLFLHLSKLFHHFYIPTLLL